MEQETKANSETNALGIDMKNKNDEPLINLREFSYFEIKDPVGKILSIIELCQNPKRYEYNCSSKTKKFWENALDEEHLHRIFQVYQPETLRKFWSNIGKCVDLDEFLFLIIKNKEIINNSKRSIGAIIESIKDYVNNNIQVSFQKFFESYSCWKKNKKCGKIKI